MIAFGGGLNPNLLQTLGADNFTSTQLQSMGDVVPGLLDGINIPNLNGGNEVIEAMTGFSDPLQLIESFAGSGIQDALGSMSGFGGIASSVMDVFNGGGVKSLISSGLQMAATAFGGPIGGAVFSFAKPLLSKIPVLGGLFG